MFGIMAEKIPPECFMGAVPMVFFISNVSFNKFTNPPTKKTEQFVFV